VSVLVLTGDQLGLIKEVLASTTTEVFVAQEMRKPKALVLMPKLGAIVSMTGYGRTHRAVGRPGGPAVIVRGGLPMHLTAIGKETRRSLVLILHDSTQPPTTPANDWVPVGLCQVK